MERGFTVQFYLLLAWDGEPTVLAVAELEGVMSRATASTTGGCLSSLPCV